MSDHSNGHELNLDRVYAITIGEALLRSRGIQKHAAVLLGVSPRVLNYVIKQRRLNDMIELTRGLVIDDPERVAIVRASLAEIATERIGVARRYTDPVELMESKPEENQPKPAIALPVDLSKVKPIPAKCLITVPEAVARAGVCRRTIYNWISDGSLAADIRRSGSIRISVESLNARVSAQKGGR